MKKIFTLLLILLLVACGQRPVDNEYSVVDINKYGNVVLEKKASELADVFAAGDVVEVVYKDTTYSMPVGTSFSDVDQGEMILRFDVEDDEAVLAVNMGNFASTIGYESIEDKLVINLSEKAGYLDEYNIRNLARSNNREDYKDLNDEDFANFRAVDCGLIRDNVLYRSSSPVDDSLNRNVYVMSFMEDVGIESIVNIGDTYEELLEYETFVDSYYSSCEFINVGMNFDYETQDFKDNLVTIVRFINENEGPYLIHCKEGKDRTGIVVALIEALMDGTYGEIEEDYLKTFVNYYQISESDEIYGKIANNFQRVLGVILDCEDVTDADLSLMVSDYFINCGLSEEEIVSFRNKLS